MARVSPPEPNYCPLPLRVRPPMDCCCASWSRGLGRKSVDIARRSSISWMIGSDDRPSRDDASTSDSGADAACISGVARGLRDNWKRRKWGMFKNWFGLTNDLKS